MARGAPLNRLDARPWFQRYGLLLGVAYASGGVVFTVLFDTPVGAGFDLTGRYLALPIGLVVFGLTFLSRARGTREPRRRVAPWLGALLVYAVLLVTTPAWVVAVNSIGAGRQAVAVEGPILAKWTRSYKTTSYYVRILDERTGRQVKLQVSSSGYRAARVGSTFSRTFFLGRLGILYRSTIE